MPVSPAALGRASLTPSEASRAHAEARENAVACRDASRPDDVPRSVPQAATTEKQARERETSRTKHPSGLTTRSIGEEDD